MVMLISEIGVYEFLKDKLKFLDSDAKKYAKQMALAEDKLRTEIKESVLAEVQLRDFATRKDLLETKQELLFSINDLGQRLEIKMEQNTKQLLIWGVTYTTAMVGIALGIAKMLF